MFHRVLNTPLISIRFTYVKFYRRKKLIQNLHNIDKQPRFTIVIVMGKNILRKFFCETSTTRTINGWPNPNIECNVVSDKDISAYLTEYEKFTGFNIKILKYHTEISLKKVSDNMKFIFHFVFKDSVFSHFKYTILNKENWEIFYKNWGNISFIKKIV